jgi:NAD(P)-dependent dehydrogenase (short-subunit alcohol dehydrogenase family)
MDLNLNGKVALVTGSTAGIGFSIAQALAQEGAHVYINGRSLQKVEDAMSKMKSIKGKLLPAPFDLEDKKGVDGLIKAVPSLDILVNNLGIYEVRPFEEITDEEWLRIFNVNVLSGVRLSRHYFPLMKKKNWGRIVFISSESAISTPSEMIHYGMTKTAQLAIARGLAELTVGTRVTVNSVLPGPTYSAGVEQYITQLVKAKNLTHDSVVKEFFTTVRPTSLIQRFITPDEVGAFVAFVCSEPAAAINGATLRVDGGVVRSII